MPYDQLVKMTTGSILDVIDDQDPNLLDQYTNLKAYYKDGADGSGSQAVMKSSAMRDMTENIYQHAIAPLKLEGTNRFVYFKLISCVYKYSEKLMKTNQIISI